MIAAPLCPLPSADDRDQRKSQKVLAELENIDDECDSKGIMFVKINDPNEAKEYGLDGIPALVYFESEIPYVYEGATIVSYKRTML